MKTAAIATLALAAAAGCGGEDGPAVGGTWAAELNSTCALVMKLDTGAGTYGVTSICDTGPGQFGAEVETGDGSASADSIYMTPRASSCPSADHRPTSAKYTLSGDQLSIVADGAVVIMTRVKATSGTTGVVLTGCWTPGGLEPHPVAPL